MKVLLIDDDVLVLSSLQSIMEYNKIEVVAMGKDGGEALELYRQSQPDIMLTDIRMKQVDGIEAAGQVLAEFPQAKILLLTTFEDEQYISEALRIGCKGYILKQNISHLIPALQAAYAGSMVFDEEIISKIKTDSPAEGNTPEWPELSEREGVILKAVADGKNNKEIAADLYLSEGTVRNYISELLSKLALRDRTQLAIYYYKCILTNSSGGTGRPK
ncbi:DNA-binding response regulator [Clostridiales bacterium COT073_COT-073]|nr:DNA-binding response regulator [Clostridiales bacterium COT073_COT-073]